MRSKKLRRIDLPTEHVYCVVNGIPANLVLDIRVQPGGKRGCPIVSSLWRESRCDGAVSTAAGRFGAITSAGASLPSPFAPGLATAAYVATATGVAADAVVQMAKPDVGQYWTNGGSSMISDYFSQKYRLASPIINEATNVFNDSEYSKSIQDFINSYWGKLREKLDKK